MGACGYADAPIFFMEFTEVMIECQLYGDVLICPAKYYRRDFVQLWKRLCMSIKLTDIHTKRRAIL